MPKRTDIKKIMLIGSGPIVIGQACEFDYSGTQACKSLKEEGYEVLLVNSNPATIMTDPDFADRTYIEPLTKDILHEIIRRERPDAILPTLGGQTALNLALELYDSGILDRYRVEMIGAKAEVIRRAEDRNLFKETMRSIGLDLPKSGSAHNMDEALAIAREIGTMPLIIRPGFTLGGTGGGIAESLYKLNPHPTKAFKEFEKDKYEFNRLMREKTKQIESLKVRKIKEGEAYAEGERKAALREKLRDEYVDALAEKEIREEAIARTEKVRRKVRRAAKNDKKHFESKEAKAKTSKKK